MINKSVACQKEPSCQAALELYLARALETLRFEVPLDEKFHHLSKTRTHSSIINQFFIFQKCFKN